MSFLLKAEQPQSPTFKHFYYILYKLSKDILLFIMLPLIFNRSLATETIISFKY